MSIHRFLPKYKAQIYAVMRIVVGILFISHGIQKVSGMINGTMPVNDIFLLLAAIIETIAGLMVIIGWQTEWAAFIASGEMAVAYFKVHVPNGLIPLNNGGELAAFYCFVFLFITSQGAGIWSFDHALRKRMS